MKKYLSFLLCLLSCMPHLQAQYESRYWIFGSPTGTNTAAGHFDFFPSGSIYTNSANPLPTVVPPAISGAQRPDSLNQDNGFEQWSVATNPFTGELLFYTDGIDLFDATHSRVNSGFSLGGNASGSQSVQICKIPGPEALVAQDDKYLIFINPTGADGSNISLEPVWYWEYTPATHTLTSQSLLPGNYAQSEVGEGMTLIPHPDLHTYWLIVRLADSVGTKSSFLVYKIDRFGVSFHNEFILGRSFPITADRKVPIGNFTYRKLPNTSKVRLAMCYSRIEGLSPNTFIITDFDPVNGNLSTNARVFHPGNAGILYDIELSPSGRYLFFSTYFPVEVAQMDLNQFLPGILQIKNFGNVRGGGLKLGPDGFIYHISNGGNFGSALGIKISRVIYPDQNRFSFSNLSNFFQENIMSIPNTYAYNFSESLPAFYAGPATQNESLLTESSFQLFQKEGGVHISWKSNLEVEHVLLRDVCGREVWRSNPGPAQHVFIPYPSIKGVHLLQVTSNKKGNWVKKLMLYP